MPNPRLRGALFTVCWLTIGAVAAVFLMVVVAGAVEALGYR